MPHEVLILGSNDGTDQATSPITHVQQKLHVVPYYWDPIGLAYVVAQQAGGGTGGAGDASAANQTTEIAKLEAIRAILAGTVTVSTGQSQPLTDTQLRASAVPVSIAGTVAVTNGLVQALTDTQLRATPVPVTNTALPLPTNAAQETGGNLATLAAKDFATSAKQDTLNTSLAAIMTPLTTAQGAVGTSVTGPMVQALSNDSPPYLTPGDVYPLSLTTDGRLRVATSASIAMTDFWVDPALGDMTGPSAWRVGLTVSYF